MLMSMESLASICVSISFLVIPSTSFSDVLDDIPGGDRQFPLSPVFCSDLLAADMVVNERDSICLSLCEVEVNGEAGVRSLNLRGVESCNQVGKLRECAIERSGVEEFVSNPAPVNPIFVPERAISSTFDFWMSSISECGPFVGFTDLTATNSAYKREFKFSTLSRETSGVLSLSWDETAAKLVITVGSGDVIWSTP